MRIPIQRHRHVDTAIRGETLASQIGLPTRQSLLRQYTIKRSNLSTVRIRSLIHALTLPDMVTVELHVRARALIPPAEDSGEGSGSRRRTPRTQVVPDAWEYRAPTLVSLVPNHSQLVIIRFQKPVHVPPHSF